MYDISHGFPEFSSKELAYLKKENQAGITMLRQEMRALLHLRLARKINKEAFDFQQSIINLDLRARRERGIDLENEWLIRAYEAPRVRQRVFLAPA
ncbi:MAG: hypothetical protein QOG67_1531 [Verrucomicrobiota bacterium]|jgi:hypothetical protein